MSHFGSDLEEGEIREDTPSPVNVYKKKRELPRRYVVQENGSSSRKHKKDCKYAILYHARRLSQLKKTPPKVKMLPKKNHKPSCSRLHIKSHKIEHKLGCLDIAKSPFKENAESKSENFPSEKPNDECLKKDFDSSKMNPSNIEASAKAKHNHTSDKKCNRSAFQPESFPEAKLLQLSVNDANNLTNFKSLDCDKAMKHEEILPHNSVEVIDEESEDEEELRRIALATCAKRKFKESPETAAQHKQNAYNVPVSESSNIINRQISYVDPALVDNYEVIDMEISDDTGENPVKLEYFPDLPPQVLVQNQNSDCAESSFVIDLSPSLDFLGNEENASELPSTDIDEADILRAQLIESMLRKKRLQEEEKHNSNISAHFNHKPVVQEKSTDIGAHFSQEPVIPEKYQDISFHLNKKLVVHEENPDITVHLKQKPIVPEKNPDKSAHLTQKLVVPEKNSDISVHLNQKTEALEKNPDITDPLNGNLSVSEKNPDVPKEKPDTNVHFNQKSIAPEKSPDITVHLNQKAIAPKKNPNISIHLNQKPGIFKKKFSVNYQKQKFNFYPKPNFYHKSLRSSHTKYILQKSLINKARNVTHNITKLSKPIEADKPCERLIIALKDESSDESDNCEEKDVENENAVDSIVALISDCRQKSDSCSKKNEVFPEAVLCLSKSQQEEYNSLVKILAEKKKGHTVPVLLPKKNGSVSPALDDIKSLEKKLSKLRENLESKRQSLTSLSDNVNIKKDQYLKAKLAVQRTKEQYVSAEKIRRTKLLEWSKCCDQLKVMKQFVSDLKKKIDQVQGFVCKINSSLQGQK